MSSNTDTVSVNLDTFKLALALIIAISAIVGFYYFADQLLLYRIVGLLVCAGVAVGIALNTEKGRSVWAFFQGTQVEVRKVVWPTRQETMQTTLIVVLMVVIVAVILWGLDIVLGWSIKALMGQGG
jgi:preprotein translocase subunit SecE